MRRTALALGLLLLGTRVALAQTPVFQSLPAANRSNIAATTTTTIVQPAMPPPMTAHTGDDGKEQLTTFDNGRVQLTWQDRRWKLTADGAVLKDFGIYEQEARQALRLVRGLHLNQHAVIGSPTVVEYWLADGAGPRGLAPGMRPLVIDSASLRADDTQGQWIIRDQQRVWFNFGLRGDEAQAALAAMKKHGFTQVVSIGGPAPLMTVFLANPLPPGAAKVSQPSTIAETNVAGIVVPTLPPLRQTEPPVTVASFRPATTTSFPGGGRPGTLATAGVTTRTTFDWRQAQVRQAQGRFRVMAGEHVIGDFGNNEKAATQALSAVKYYQFTEHYQVGPPGTTVSYFLVHGQTPRGIPFGVQGQPIDAEHLAVQQMGERYAVVANGRPVWQFGTRPDDARTMLDVVRRHHFDHVCHIGGDEAEGMTFLVAAR